MSKYNFRFKYSTSLCKASGSGSVEACDMDEAMESAREGVANDFGGSVSSVQITTIKKVKSKGKRRVNSRN